MCETSSKWEQTICIVSIAPASTAFAARIAWKKKKKSVLLPSQCQGTNDGLVMYCFLVWLPQKGLKEVEDLSFKVKKPHSPQGNK